MGERGQTRLLTKGIIIGGSLSWALLTGTTGVHAGGLFISEMGTPDLGTASAGRAALAEDAATAFGNPAGMTRLKDSQILVGLQGGYGIVEFDKGNDTTVSGGNGGNAVGGFPGAGLYGVYSVTPEFKLGLTVSSNFGGSLEYEDGWSGRYYGTTDQLTTLGAWPVAAYKVNDWLSIGGGAQIVYGRLNVKTAVRNVYGGPDGQIQLKSNDVGFGGLAGILIEPVAGTRFGVTYTSPIDMSFKQRPDLTGGGPVFNALDPRISQTDIDLGLTIPQTVLVSGYHELTPEIAIMGNFTWQNWTQFGQPTIEISSTKTRKTTANLNYDDTYGFALGGRWRFLPQWAWTAGFAYDTSPISKKDRSPALPLDQQIRVGTGVQYTLSERIKIGAAYEYLNLGEADINRNKGPLTGQLQGNYSTNEVHFFNVTVGWIF